MTAYSLCCTLWFELFHVLDLDFVEDCVESLTQEDWTASKDFGKDFVESLTQEEKVLQSSNVTAEARGHISRSLKGC